MAVRAQPTETSARPHIRCGAFLDYLSYKMYKKTFRYVILKHVNRYVLLAFQEERLMNWLQSLVARNDCVYLSSLSLLREIFNYHYRKTANKH